MAMKPPAQVAAVSMKRECIMAACRASQILTSRVKPVIMPPMQIHVAKADLVEIPVDALVNPANSQGLMLGGVAGALREAGGRKIEDEAKTAAPIAVGAAVVTTAG